MASEYEGDKDSRELVLASIHQADHLTRLLSNSLTVLDESSSTSEGTGRFNPDKCLVAMS